MPVCAVIMWGIYFGDTRDGMEIMKGEKFRKILIFIFYITGIKKEKKNLKKDTLL